MKCVKIFYYITCTIFSMLILILIMSMQIYILVFLLQKSFRYLAFIFSYNIKVNVFINLFLLLFIYARCKFCKYITNITFSSKLLINIIIFGIAKAILAVEIRKASLSNFFWFFYLGYHLSNIWTIYWFFI